MTDQMHDINCLDDRVLVMRYNNLAESAPLAAGLVSSWVDNEEQKSIGFYQGAKKVAIQHLRFLTTKIKDRNIKQPRRADPISYLLHGETMNYIFEAGFYSWVAGYCAKKISELEGKDAVH